MNTKSCIFTSGEATNENTAFVFMSEIKINLTPEKIKFSVSFILKCGKKVLISARKPSSQKTNFFPSRCASTLWYSTYLLGIILGVN